MAKNRYNSARDAVNSLTAKGFIVSEEGKTIVPPSQRNPQGISVWGTVDYLVNFCGYRLLPRLVVVHGEGDE